MLRLGFLPIFAGGAAPGSWQIITTDPGSLTLRWGDTEVVTSALFGLMIFVVVVALALPLLRLLMFLMDAPGRIGKSSERAGARKAKEVWALGLIAAEAGELEEAPPKADRAENLI